jgi:hypothetical protein
LRHRSWRAGYGRVLWLIGLLLLADSGIPRAAARQSTPAASPATATCDVAPRSTAEILTLAGAESSESEPIPGLPSGEPADPGMTAAITAALGEMAACLTAGDMLRFYALHSDDWLRRSLGMVEGMALLTTSIPPLDDGHQAGYLGPWHVQILADSRVLAAALLVVGDELRPDPNRTRVLLFAHRDGRWLVDETIASVHIAGCADPVEVAAVVGPPPGTIFDSWTPACG